MDAVIGINNATKQLSKFLDCTKEYRAIGLLGCATDSYDSDGKRVKMAPFSDITAEKVEAVLSAYRGEITQIPPMSVAPSLHSEWELIGTQFLGAQDGRKAFVRVREEQPPPPSTRRVAPLHRARTLAPPIHARGTAPVRVPERGARGEGDCGTGETADDGQGGRNARRRRGSAVGGSARVGGDGCVPPFSAW